MQAEGIRTFRNFDAINLLFRPDKYAPKHIRGGATSRYEARNFI